jgi:hypothetical protein
MNDALLHRLIQRRDALAENLFGGGLVAFGERFAQLAQRGAQAGRVGPVAGGSFLSLTGAFQRGKMICHVLLLAFSVGFLGKPEPRFYGTNSRMVNRIPLELGVRLALRIHEPLSLPSLPQCYSLYLKGALGRGDNPAPRIA